MTTLPRWIWADVAAYDAPDGAVRLVHVSQGAALVVRHGRLVPEPGYREAPASARRAVARVGAMLRLRGRGRYLLHAAAVVSPADEAWLLTGDSGSGKSTLACALANEGWRVLGDDGVIIECRGGAAIAYAWRDPLLVSDWMLDRMPLAGSRGRPPQTDDPRRRVAVLAAPARRARVVGVLFPRQGARDELRPMPVVEALAGLVRQSPWALLDDPVARAHLDALSALARSVPAWRLQHSPAMLDRVGALLAGCTGLAA